MADKKRERPDEPGRKRTLTGRQEDAALLLAGGLTYEATARQVRASVSTVKEWSASLPEFRARVEEVRAELSRRVLATMSRGMLVAIRTLVKLCREGATETSKLRAAEALLGHGTTLTEVNELKARLARLENPL